jgi:DNA-binding NarL/FixJ family response regulator
MQSIDYNRLKRDYPEVEFIGLVGFDTKRQQFVLLAIGQDTNDDGEGREVSEREREVLQLVSRGFTNFQIAQKLAITENTVKTHLQHIFAKLKVKSRTEAAMLAVQRGWMIR